MDAHTCNHPLVAHRVTYSLGKASVSKDFNDLEEAEIFAQKILRQNKGRLRWLKVNRADNDSYVCFRWDNPDKEQVVAEVQKVKLEVDMEPLKSAFDNVAEGFADQGRSIKKLKAMQVVFAAAVILTNVGIYVIR